MLSLQFILTYSGTDYEVEEPRGFQDFNSVLERDFDTHGAFFRFTEGDLKLGFVGEGRDVLKAARDGFGVDADVLLTVKRRFRDTDPYTTIYTGNAVMENLVIDEDYASTDFEEIDYMILIKDRIDIPVNTTQTTDLDGNAISAATETDFAMGAKTILKKIKSTVSASDSLYLIDGGGGLVFNTPLPTGADFIMELSIDEYQNGYSGSQSMVASPQLDFGGIHTIEPGSISFSLDITVTGTLRIARTLPLSGAGAGTLTFYLVEGVKNPDETFTETDLTIGTVNFASTSAAGNIDFTPNYSVTRTVTTATKYYRIKLLVSGGGGITQEYQLQTTVISTTDFSLTIEATTTETETDVSGYFIHEALRHNVEAVAGDDILYAPFIGRTADGYSSDGCAAYYTEANGWRIRGFTNGITSSLKKRLDNLKNIFGLGYGIERESAGSDTYRFRVDQIDYFYNDELLYAFTEVVDYQEEFHEWFKFNEVEVGYKDYITDEDEPGGTEDFNSVASWSIDTKLRGKKQFISEYIASDLLAEITRRKQFEKKPTTTDRYDDNIFISEIESDGAGGWEIGTDKTVVRDQNINPLFNVLINPKFNFFNQYYLINSVVWRKNITQSYRNTTFKNGGDLKIYYSSVLPTSNCLGDLTQGSPSLPNLQPAIKANFTIARVRGGVRLFDPIRISFKVALSTTQVDNIIEAHRNGLESTYTLQMGAGSGSFSAGDLLTESTSGYTGTVISYSSTTGVLVISLTNPAQTFTVGRSLSISTNIRFIVTITENNSNYGFIRVTNPDGETVEGWILKMGFNYADQIANFELIKKADEYLI